MPSQTNTDQLADSAQQQLAVLREALESRLVTLEEVLADPSRGESLAGLILDLSRIATEEAQAAAAHACLAIKAEADKETTELRTSAKTAVEAAQAALRAAHASLEQERAISADLRRAADQADQEIRKQTELLAAREKLEATLKGGREQLESEVARQKAIAADIQRAAADAQKQLETERAAARKVHDKVAAELMHAREELAERDRAQAELQSALDGERAAVAGARGAVELAETRVATLEDEQEAVRAAHEAVVADAVRETSMRERAYAELQARLEAERAAAVELRSQLQVERASAAGLQSEMDVERASAAELHARLEVERASGTDLRSQLEAERAAAAELRLAAGRDAERVTELGATLGRETSEGRAAHQELSSELDRQRDLAALLQKELADGHLALAAVRADLEIERTSSADLRQALEFADHQLAGARSGETQTLADHVQLAAQLDGLRAELDEARTRLEGLTAERDAVAEELQATRKWIDDLHQAEAEFASSPAGPPPDAVPTIAPSSGHEQKATATKDDDDDADGWQAVRLANRYVFADEVVVQINGDPGQLFDLSITGCQLLSPTALKPNHTVKVTLPDGKQPVTCTGTVVWTRVEPSAGAQAIRYRAGVRFTKVNELAVESFASRHGATA